MLVVGWTSHSSYFIGLGLRDNWFQVAVQLIILLFLDARKKSKTQANYRVLHSKQVTHSNSH